MEKAIHDNIRGEASRAILTKGERMERWMLSCTVVDMKMDTPEEQIIRMGTIRHIAI